MYKITSASDGVDIGMTEAVTYIRLNAKNGCYTMCDKQEAQGVAYASTPYNLFGKESMGDLPTVLVTEVDAGKELGTVQQAMQTVQQQTASNAFMSSQMHAAAMLYVQAATDIPDATALKMPDLFKTWEEVLAAGKELEANTIINDGGQLYRVVQAVTPQEGQPPHGDGMLAVYRPIDKQHTGTADDPIPFVSGMDTEKGKYYSYNGKVYLCQLDMKPCVWAPDTPGLWQWEEVTE